MRQVFASFASGNALSLISEHAADEEFLVDTISSGWGDEPDRRRRSSNWVRDVRAWDSDRSSGEQRSEATLAPFWESPPPTMVSVVAVGQSRSDLISMLRVSTRISWAKISATTSALGYISDTKPLWTARPREADV